MLESNLNIGVDRLPPQIAQFLIDTFLRPFDPTLHITASGTRGTTLSTSQLNGAQSLVQLTHSYDVGVGQTLTTGTSYGVDAIVNRTSSNNAFALYNLLSPTRTSVFDRELSKPPLTGSRTSSTTPGEGSLLGSFGLAEL